VAIIVGRVDLEEFFQAPLLLGALKDMKPDTALGGVNIAVTRGRAAAGTVTQATGTAHRANSSSLPQEAVAARPAAEEHHFHQASETW
jgi:hypothetical protein